jgi:dipeptidyl aminopeptidase/acylaminoacyl peptidase
MKRIFFQGLLVTFLALACATSRAVPTLTPAPSSTATLPAATASPTSTTIPSPTPRPDPYWTYTIPYLQTRAYSGKLDIFDTVERDNAFTRYLVRYTSDDLHINGFIDVPRGDGPFPVVIALHGYIDPPAYTTLDYTTRYADALARAGYLVIHPNLRGYAPSDDGDNLFRVGMAIDVLNLIAIVKSDGGVPGPLRFADPSRIGLWGHSMGGGIVTRVLTVSHDVKAAVLYAPMSGDEQKNYDAIRNWTNGSRGVEEWSVPTEELPHISPMYFFNDITAAVSIHHGLADQLVPVEWSVLTCAQLKLLGKNVECTFYPGMPHTFDGKGDEEFIQAMIQFLDRTLKP